MKVFKGIEQADTRVECAITVGTFDGLHKGHCKIIDRLKLIATERELCTTLVTFDPHPKVVVRPDLAGKVGLLTTLNEKTGLLKHSGINRLVIIPFDKKFSQTSYERFVKQILIDKLGAQVIIVGYDHGFGKNREGNYEKLQELGLTYGFYVEQIGSFELEGEIISSTVIRNCLRQGDVVRAARYLGRPYTLCGKVIEGNNLGKTYNFPTANIEVADPYKLVPANGVYAVDVDFDGNRHKGMLNIGYRPTFGLDQHSIETHIFGYNGNLYDKYLTVYFKERLRDERKFDSTEALVKQLKIDKNKSLMI
jgi:riboflavin kinase/FMN adenylyltransferase